MADGITAAPVAELHVGDTVILILHPATTLAQNKETYDRLRADFPQINWYLITGPTHVLHMPAGAR